jgi:hypothetical protein
MVARDLTLTGGSEFKSSASILCSSSLSRLSRAESGGKLSCTVTETDDVSRLLASEEPAARGAKGLFPSSSGALLEEEEPKLLNPSRKGFRDDEPVD